VVTPEEPQVKELVPDGTAAILPWTTARIISTRKAVRVLRGWHISEYFDDRHNTNPTIRNGSEEA
jgi:hypothetical protein